MVTSSSVNRNTTGCLLRHVGPSFHRSVCFLCNFELYELTTPAPDFSAFTGGFRITAPAKKLFFTSRVKKDELTYYWRKTNIKEISNFFKRETLDFFDYLRRPKS